MRFIFRADASVAIGTGHVVRCATLANVLRQAGHEIEFICSHVPGNLIGWLNAQGFAVAGIEGESAALRTAADAAGAARRFIGDRRFDWLVVDHYGLGAEWESAMASIAMRILAIDDIGRTHHCDALLDQNFSNPAHDRYRQAAGGARALLLGPRFALVRSEFPALRDAALARHRGEIRRVLVFMGGSDPCNETTKALEGIGTCGRADMALDVVIGEGNPHRAAVSHACTLLPHARLHVQTNSMAELMAAADLAIGAGGSTTWERCVVGLPALVTILADNQTPIAQAISAAGAQKLLGRYESLSPQDYARALNALRPEEVTCMSRIAADICDGLGAKRVAAYLSGQADYFSEK